MDYYSTPEKVDSLRSASPLKMADFEAYCTNKQRAVCVFLRDVFLSFFHYFTKCLTTKLHTHSHTQTCCRRLQPHSFHTYIKQDHRTWFFFLISFVFSHNTISFRFVSFCCLLLSWTIHQIGNVWTIPCTDTITFDFIFRFVSNG